MAQYCSSFRNLSSSFYLCFSMNNQEIFRHLPSVCNLCRKNCSSSSTSVSEPDLKIIQPNIKSQLQESKQGYAKINKAMKMYLEKAAEYDKLLSREKEAYELGRRHLANIMGKSPETFDKEDIKEAVSYLLPSSLTHLGARPVIPEPEDVYPKSTSASFDVTGRPHSTFFYTMKPQFFNVLHTAVSKLQFLNEYEDKQISKGIFVPPEHKILNARGTEWTSQEQLEILLMEKFPSCLYDEFLYCFNNILKHPYSYLEKDFVFTYRVSLPDPTVTLKLPEPIMREDGRQFIEATGYRKKCKAHVKVLDKGTGLFSVNNQDIRFFELLQNREQVMFPLQFTGQLHKVDIECVILEGVGESANAGAIRHGISLALAGLSSSAEHERMRIAGLLTADFRKSERNKPGQKGARAKYPWKKR